MDIILDFDGTITTHDTIHTLANYAISKNGGSTEWDDIVKAYTLDHEEFHARYSPGAADRTTAEEELTFLNCLRGVEQASLGRVQNSGLFRAISPDDLSRFGESAVKTGIVRIRPGFRELRARLSGHLAVVSVNWSADFIRGCCGSGGDGLEVFANAIEFPSGQLVCPVPGGEGVLLTARDKFVTLQTVARRWGRKPGELVYVGDSTTDLECLLACKGIVMAEDVTKGLVETLRRLGFEVRHVADCKPDFRIAWARDFKEILDSGILGSTVASEAEKS